ncbi:hypothetical protein [Fluviispira sanaruensis]|uniref:Uncharacterized protein n=1 Tax=Fluviispira sanaruensis TaxID=2493639 RepID=A0A4P2VNM7_FLUSA|nr:hypothetical protein [Fluviispira sanaruensis]BBH53640.1 hypothetical protein JCM31447_20870 [Fluviispira sanaruensis]
MLQEFCVDIWFCYGSFSYGFESEIHDFGENELALSLQTQNEEQGAQIDSFFEQVVDKPKGLLRVELRVYGPEKVFKRHKISGPVHLFTDIVPKQIPYEGKSPLLKFVSVKGISPTNTEYWHKLVRQIWNQRQQKASQKR